MLHDTIAAVATPPGEGGLAVVRISGPEATQVAGRCFRPAGGRNLGPVEAPSHTVHYGRIEAWDTVVDEVLLTVLRAPRTFTREDTVEIACHGGVLVTHRVLDAVLAAGARMAQPGEFTRRAFLHGRIDLTQAEAVADLIHARSELALQSAREQLAGSLGRRVEAVREGLMLALAHLEAHLDFPDEDIAPDTGEAILARVRSGLAAVQGLRRGAEQGRILRQGVRAAILGRPNAGKSSLLNLLLGQDRAIVSPVPGTTRDTIEETVPLAGIPFVLVDTAGLRESTDVVEQEGMRRTRWAAERAEVLIHVLDAGEPLAEADRAWLEEFAGRRRVVVANKIDLPVRLTLPGGGEWTGVSCRTGAGLEELRQRLAGLVLNGRGSGAGDPDQAINARHHDALRRAEEALARCATALERGEPPDLAALDLRLGVQAVGEVVGRTTTEDLLDRIFSTFCLGK
ncbi:MAG: tRNA uridine-5-carboxymethylaminomethyl(34) synthesis GTPase MnmE [Verrucomicrobiota bacterium]